MENPKIAFNADVPENTITFMATEDAQPVEILRINKEGFYYRGEKVEDVHNVYERFNEWLTRAENK